MVGRTIDTIEEPISIKSKSVIACESFKKIRNNFQDTKQLLQFHVIGGKVNDFHLIFNSTKQTKL